jgi:hypothetical protein
MLLVCKVQSRQYMVATSQFGPCTDTELYLGRFYLSATSQGMRTAAQCPAAVRPCQGPSRELVVQQPQHQPPSVWKCLVIDYPISQYNEEFDRDTVVIFGAAPGDAREPLVPLYYTYRQRVVRTLSCFGWEPDRSADGQPGIFSQVLPWMFGWHVSQRTIVVCGLLLQVVIARRDNVEGDEPVEDSGMQDACLYTRYGWK